jgi:WD40 repeat protein
LSIPWITTRLSNAHKGKITGLTWSTGDRLVSCGVDQTIKLWNTRREASIDDDGPGPSTVCTITILTEYLGLFKYSQLNL